MFNQELNRKYNSRLNCLVVSYPSLIVALLLKNRIRGNTFQQTAVANY